MPNQPKSAAYLKAYKQRHDKRKAEILEIIENEEAAARRQNRLPMLNFMQINRIKDLMKRQ